ncbi:6076_t:CDS:2, partial [Funneliformis caledonium]
SNKGNEDADESKSAWEESNQQGKSVKEWTPKDATVMQVTHKRRKSSDSAILPNPASTNNPIEIISKLCLIDSNKPKGFGVEEQLEYITKYYKSIEKEDECTLMEEFYVLVKKDNKQNLTILNEILLSAENRLGRRD